MSLSVALVSFSFCGERDGNVLPSKNLPCVVLQALLGVVTDFGGARLSDHSEFQRDTPGTRHAAAVEGSHPDSISSCLQRR